ncbi:hypothetical protein [Vampirovibrio chlorellavorus]|uniref:hypothetical protein n=1 Tax=Vampirovibrio chlorellavorus TaxID=758823 RepID=UPI0026F0AF3F|nr:hypothetical protein [Vampirovibrio chlorellavorus]
MTQQEKLILFYVGLFCLAVVIISFAWRSDSYYSNAYTPVVEKSNRNKAIEAQNRKMDGQSGSDSNQPNAAGFREKDIDKNRGERFSTY